MAKLYAPPDYFTAPQMLINQICNGCGSSNAKFDFVPDTIYGLDISQACKVHDWMYHFGQTNEDKEKADRSFRNNLIRLIDERGGFLRPLRRWRAGTYYLAVDRYGGPAFWNGKDIA